MRDQRAIHGYGQVFEGNYEIHSVPDRGRNRPLPFPVPVRSIGYFLAALAAITVLRALPDWTIIGLLFGLLKFAVAYVVIPLIAAVALTKLEPHGRPATRHVAALLRHRLAPKERCLGQPVRPTGAAGVFDPVTVLADAATAELTPGVVEGPSVVEFREPVVLMPHRRRGRFVARPQDTSPGWPRVTRVELHEGERLTVRPS